MTAPDETSAGRGKAAPGVFAAAGLIAAVTLVARVFGFGRWLVFSQSVGTTCVGSVYQAANQLPNVIFEVAAGGAMAAVAVPIIAGQLARKDEAAATRTGSAMLTWALTVLVPLSILMAAAAAPLSSLLVPRQACAGSTDLMASMIVVFAPQIALYGVGITLAGVLQAHRRFLGAALAPLLSSAVVIATYLLYGVLAQGNGDDLARLPSQASTVLAAGTTLGVVALSLPLLIPLHRAGIRLHPTWAFPDGVARRASALAGAGLIALVAQQVAVLVTLWVSQHRGGTGTLNVYTYVQAVYLLPYAVLAVPVATAAFPAMASGPDRTAMATGPDQTAMATVSAQADRVTASAQIAGGPGQTPVDQAQGTLVASVRAITAATCAAAAVLFAIAGPTGAFFSALDAGRNSPAGRQALAALPDALSAFAPGLVGFGLAALLTRALYIHGRPAVAGGLVGLGWLIAAVLPLVLLQNSAGPRKTLQSLGFASSLGMTIAAIALVVAVQRAWGPRTFRGLGRSAAVALGSGVFSAAAGRALAESLHPTGLVAGASVALVVAFAVMTVCVASIWVGDPESARLVAAKLRRGAR
ncbi:MAG: lipid II flippase MurJ [Actinomycetota bacterium]